MAFRLTLDERGQLLREIIGSETSVQITCDMFFLQQVESDFVAQIVRLHLQLVALQGMVAALYFGGAIGSHHQQALAPDTLREMPKEIDARRIRPMKILEQQDHGRGGSQSLESVAHFAKHALLACTNGLAL